MSNAQDDRERGAGTVLVLALAAVVLLVALAIAAVGSAQRARGSAQTAADLGALAAATALQEGLDPCATAAAVAERHGADLAACRPQMGGVVEVTASKQAVVAGGSFGRLLGPATAAARAGPRPAPRCEGQSGSFTCSPVSGS